LAFLVETIFPSFYRQVNILAEKEGVNNDSELLVSFYMERVAISIEELEDRHIKRAKDLSFLAADNQVGSMSASSLACDSRTLLLVENWFREMKSQKSQGDEEEFLDLKSLLRSSIKQLRQIE
jgi:hypothetical protein